MRAALIMLALLCAVISGWSAALARTQGLSGPQPLFHHVGALGEHAKRHGANPQESECDAQADRCCHPVNPVHPLLCAACFAIATEAADLSVQVPVRSRVAPALQAAMSPALLKPRSPPPKELASH